MNNALRKLLEAAETWTADEQAELVDHARAIEARRRGIYVVDEHEKAAIGRGLAEADSGRFAGDEELAALKDLLPR